MYGHLVDSDEDSACGNCKKVEDIVQNKITPNSEVPVNYKHYDVYSSEEGKKMVDEGLNDIPFTRDCKIYSDGTDDCREVRGWNSEHWKESKKK